MFLALGVLVSSGRLAISPSPSSRGFPTLLNAGTVGSTLSLMLQTAGTTVHSRRKVFNRPQSISYFSSSALEGPS